MELINTLSELNEDLTTVQQPIVLRFEILLAKLQGENLGSLEANQRIASLIQDTANRLQVAFLCPRCQEPARFKCVQDSNVKTGVFTFVHTGGNHMAPSKIPLLVLTKPPPDRRRTRKTK